MSLEVRPECFDVAQHDSVYLGRRVHEAATAAGSAHSVAATPKGVELATAGAKRSCNAEDRAWVAEHRLW